MNPLVSTQAASYAYEYNSNVVRDLSADIHPGETIRIVGTSVTGKSTAIGILCGELPALWGGTLGGQVTWSHDLLLPDRSGPDIRLIGTLLRSPQEHFTGFLDSVADELAFDLEARSWDESEIASRIRQVSDTLGINHLLERNPFTLSGGEKQRVALGLSAAADPKLVVLDDPTANLDALASESWLNSLRILLQPDAAVIFESRDANGLPNTRAIIAGESSLMTSASAVSTLRLPRLPKTISRLTVRCRAAGYVKNTNVIRDLDLDLSAGQCIGLIGPNGAGKTTLLKAIAGTLTNFEGEINIDGRDLTRLPPHERCSFIGLALQDSRDQLFAATVQEELAFGARVARKLSKHEAHDAAQIYAEALRIRHLLYRHPRALSRSEGRKVGLASTLMLESSVLLLDEPTLGLGLEDRQLLTAVIIEHQNRGGSIVVASHDREWLSSVTDSCLQFPVLT